MTDKTIYNCHCHIFTDKNLPDNYLPMGLVPLFRNEWISKSARWLMRKAQPLSKTDLLHRTSTFLEATYEDSQEANLKDLMRYYPPKSKFIILPMDLGLMTRRSYWIGADKRGKVREDIDTQHQKLAELAAKEEYKEVIIPFAHIDPRRPDALQRLKDLVENHHFKGVKIYPPLGYKPTDPRLMNEIYPYMVEKNIPLLAHCSPGTVYTHEVRKKVAHQYAHPKNYQAVMKAFPQLRICLGHFGGISEWRRYFAAEHDEKNQPWVQVIIDMMRDKSYPNLYADISYTIFDMQENVPLLKVLLEDDEAKRKILFGSDFFMVENHKYSEKRLSIDLRATLGEKAFWQIANTNPKAYLEGNKFDVDSLLKGRTKTVEEA